MQHATEFELNHDQNWAGVNCPVCRMSVFGTLQCWRFRLFPVRCKGKCLYEAGQKDSTNKLRTILGK